MPQVDYAFFTEVDYKLLLEVDYAFFTSTDYKLLLNIVLFNLLNNLC